MREATIDTDWDVPSCAICRGVVEFDAVVDTRVREWLPRYFGFLPHPEVSVRYSLCEEHADDVEAVSDEIIERDEI